MFEIVSDLQDGPLKLEDLGFNHISLFVENMDKAISDACDAGAIPLSITCITNCFIHIFYK